MSWLPHLPVRSEQDTTANFETVAAAILKGRGAPEGFVGAPVGTIYLREGGGPGNTMYVKESGVTPTDPKGWVAK